jgi:tape measure domain-containing protein
MSKRKVTWTAEMEIRDMLASMKEMVEVQSESLQKMEKQAEESGGRMSDVLKGSFLGSFSGNIAAKGFELVTSALSGVADAMIGGNAEMETYQASFETMLGSANRATKLLDEVKVLGASTPFEFPELAAASRNLVAFGVNADDAVPLLRRLGDVASGVNMPIGDLSELFGKARVSGTLYAEDINQLVGRGIPVISEFAKILGVSEGQVKAMASEGKISYGVLEQALNNMTNSGGQFSGMMEKQSATFSGLASTMGDTLGEIGRTIGKPFFDLFKAGLGAALEFLGSPAVQGAVAGLAAVISGLTNFMSENGDVVLYLTGLVGAYVVVMELATIKTKLAAAGQALFMGVQRAQAIVTGGNIAAHTALMAVMSAQGIQAKAAAAWTAILTTAQAAWGIITGGVTAAMAALNVVMAANPIALIVIAIAALIGGLVLAYNKITVVRAAVNAVWATMKAYFNFLMNMGALVIDILVGIFTLDFERAGKAIARTGDVVVAGMKDMATAGAKAYNEEMEKGREENEDNQKESLDRQQEEEEKAAKARAQAAAEAYMKEWGSQNVLKDLSEKQQKILAGLRTNFSEAGVEQARREYLAIEKEKERIQAQLDRVTGKEKKKSKKDERPFADALEADILNGANELIAEMDDKIGQEIDRINTETVENEKQAFEASQRIREMRIDMIDNEVAKLWAEYEMKVEIAKREIENEEEKQVRLKQLERVYGRDISKARKDSRKKEDDAYEKSKQAFMDDYAAPIAQASTDLILSLTDDKMTALEREQMFWNSMKNIALDVSGQILQKLITDGIMMLAESVGLLASQVPLAAAAGSMWAGPAALASTATFGGAAVAGAAGLTTTFGLAQAIGTPKFLKDGGLLNKPTFVAAEAGTELVGSLRDIIPIIRESVMGPTQRRTKITQSRSPRVDVGIGNKMFGRGSRSAQHVQTAGVF